jgi:RHS repeat-associated protein
MDAPGPGPGTPTRALPAPPQSCTGTTSPMPPGPGPSPGCLAKAISANPFFYDGQYLDHTSGLYYLRARWYDPQTGQFTSLDPLVAVTNEPYGYAGGDPVNNIDPLGLCWPSFACVVEHKVGAAATRIWNDTGGKAVHWVKTHPKKAIGIGLGILSAATGVGAIVEGATFAGVVLGMGSVAAGVGASALDYGSCVNGHEAAACVGLGLDASGAFLGAFGVAGAGLAFGEVIAEDSLAASILDGIGEFGLNVGLSGTAVDVGSAFANTAQVCSAS